MTVPSHSFPITRRLFLEKGLKGATALGTAALGTAALAIPGIVIFAPARGAGADRFPRFIATPSPQFPAWTQDGNLLITFVAEDGGYGFLQDKRKANAADIVSSVGAGKGQFNWPQGIAADGSLVYIVDSNNGRIQRFNLETQSFLEPFGGLGRKSGLFFRPRGMCIFGDELFIADTRNHRIQVFSKDGEVKRHFGELGDADEQFRQPTDCALSAQGELFVVDSKHAFIKVFDLEGRFLRKFGGLSSAVREAGTLNTPAGIALNGKKEIVCVADTGNSRIQAFDFKGRFLRLIEAPDMAFKSPQGIAWRETGEMAITDPDAGKTWITMA
jgi:DNA-binding beta-propeller fold protein YncE